MKAVVFYEHGGPEVLQYEDLPEPCHGPTEVLIRVKAAGVNHNDLWARDGMPGMKVIFPHISGSDLSGVVEAVGDLVTTVKPGDEVVMHPGLSCRKCPQCTSGQEYFCREFRIYGFQTGPIDGAFAQFVKLPEVNVLPKPANLTWEEAASIPLCLLTVWHMLVSRAKVQPGEDVLVWGGSSGVGSLAIQVAKLRGARVVTTGGSQKKLDRAQELGADAVVNHYEGDVVKAVLAFTGKKGVDVVFEHTGEKTWERSITSMARAGRLVTCGNTSGYNAITDLRHLFWKQLNLLGSHQGTKAELAEAMKHVAAGQIRPVVDRALPLKDLAEAQRVMAASEHFGSIVIVPE